MGWLRLNTVGFPDIQSNPKVSSQMFHLVWLGMTITPAGSTYVGSLYTYPYMRRNGKDIIFKLLVMCFSVVNTLQVSKGSYKQTLFQIFLLKMEEILEPSSHLMLLHVCSDVK